MVRRFVMISCRLSIGAAARKKRSFCLFFFSFFFWAMTLLRWSFRVEMISPTSGRVLPDGIGSWIPTGCSDKSCWSSSRSSGGRSSLRGGCKIVWKHKSKANVWKRNKRKKKNAKNRGQPAKQTSAHDMSTHHHEIYMVKQNEHPNQSSSSSSSTCRSLRRGGDAIHLNTRWLDVDSIAFFAQHKHSSAHQEKKPKSVSSYRPFGATLSYNTRVFAARRRCDFHGASLQREMGQHERIEFEKKNQQQMGLAVFSFHIHRNSYVT